MEMALLTQTSYQEIFARVYKRQEIYLVTVTHVLITGTVLRRVPIASSSRTITAGRKQFSYKQLLRWLNLNIFRARLKSPGFKGAQLQLDSGESALAASPWLTLWALLPTPGQAGASLCYRPPARRASHLPQGLDLLPYAPGACRAGLLPLPRH